MLEQVSPSVLRLSLDSQPLDSTIFSHEISPASGIHIAAVQHGAHAREGLNLLQLAHKGDAHARALVYDAAQSGFVAYASVDDETRFVRLSHIPSFWTPCKDGTYRTTDSGVTYTVQGSSGRWPEAAAALFVIFSSMANPWNKASLTRHFEQNFASASKHLPEGVAVLRIADLDGVVGGFYLPTVNYPTRDRDVAALIDDVRTSLGVPRDLVVTYGASKGGSAALHMGLRFGYHAISVDPVVTDHHYETRYPDAHWTRGNIFLRRKRAIFTDDAAISDQWEDASWAILSGTGSPLYDEVHALVEPLARRGRALFLTSTDARITEHPHVSPRTLRTATGLMNLYLQGIRTDKRPLSIYG